MGNVGRFLVASSEIIDTARLSALHTRGSSENGRMTKNEPATRRLGE